jgi:hypothetical protein
MCNSQTKPRESVFRVVVETKEVTYPERKDANVFYRSEKIDDVWVKGKIEKSDDPGGRGTQIVKEILICKRCVELQSISF